MLAREEDIGDNEVPVGKEKVFHFEVPGTDGGATFRKEFGCVTMHSLFVEIAYENLAGFEDYVLVGSPS